ncbi:hypothetical protein ACFE04_027964 [Oxalis oulophora]
MDNHQWRLGSICPMCSISHFPFCPPPPQPPYRFPPPPPPAPPSQLDYHHNPMHWHTNNFTPMAPPPPTHYPSNHMTMTYSYAIDDVDRTFKRPRLDVDDERRLKLIHDHGGVSPSPPPPPPPNPPPPPPPTPPPQTDYWQAFSGSNYTFLPNNHYMSQYHNSYASPNMPITESVPYLPPLPNSPPPPLPVEPPTLPSLFPVLTSSSSVSPTIRPHASAGFVSEEPRGGHPVSNVQSNQFHPEKQRAIDVLQLFKHPYRATRPGHLVIILRGLPGSGKSYLAKLLRDLEVENGGDAPRIHSMDDYFMTEVEKVEECDVSQSSSSVKSKKKVVKKVMEYCYEPEMEEAYRSSMLKAFTRNLEEGTFNFIIVDDRNLRVADFAQFWAIGKRSGYEVYILEADYKDPAGCAARNVHGFTQDQIQKMAGQWEEAPSLYMQLDIKTLLNRDDLKESGIQEVVMDMVDEEADEGPSVHEGGQSQTVEDRILNDEQNEEGCDGEGESSREVKPLGMSKWSDSSDNNHTENFEGVRNVNSLAGLNQAYKKGGKSVHWPDQVGDTGFLIGAAKKARLSLVTGPGAGYNSKSNPLAESDRGISTGSSRKSKKQNGFNERLRAERESFKAVFDRRRQRIGIQLEDE